MNIEKALNKVIDKHLLSQGKKTIHIGHSIEVSAMQFLTTKTIEQLKSDALAIFKEELEKEKAVYQGYEQLALDIKEQREKAWTLDEIIEELKDIDAFDSAKYFFDKFK